MNPARSYTSSRSPGLPSQKGKRVGSNNTSMAPSTGVLLLPYPHFVWRISLTPER